MSHSIQRVAEPESATIRSTIVTANTAIPSPVATRRVRPSCEVTAPTAMNTAGATTKLTPYRTVSANGNASFGSRPAIATIAVVPTKSTTTAPASPASVAAVALVARVPPDSTSCHRPESSSPRRSLVAASSPQIAPIVVRKTKHL